MNIKDLAERRTIVVGAAAAILSCLVIPATAQNVTREMHAEYSSALSKAFELQCPESLPLGFAIQFTGTYTNEGEVAIDNVSFTVTVTNLLSLSDFTTTQGTWTPGAQNASLAMGTVNPGVVVTFTFLISTVDLGTATLTSQYSGESQESCDIEVTPPSGTVYAAKYNDLNGNGTMDEGEPYMEGWDFFLDENDNGELDEGERVASTDTSGMATFENVPLGTYNLIEVVRDGWVITEPHGFSGYSVELTQSGQGLLGSFGNFRIPLYAPVAMLSDPALFRVIDRFGDPMPDGTFDLKVASVSDEYDYTYLNVVVDLNGDGMIADYPVSKDSDQSEWVLRNVPLPGTNGLLSTPRFSAWFPLPDMTIGAETEIPFVAGLTSDLIEVPDNTPIELIMADLVSTVPLEENQWGDNDPNGQEVPDQPEPEPATVPFPEITFVDFIPGPNDPNGMPDIAQKHNECGPTSTANSLIWLANKHNFSDRLPQKDGEVDQDQLILDLMQAMAGNQTRPFGGLQGDELHDGKKTYIQARNLPLVVEGGNTDDNAKGAKAFEFIRNEVPKGQDVELLIGWPRGGSHWVTVTGYATSSEKKAVLFVHDPDDKKTAEVVWQLEVNASDQITGKVKSPNGNLLWAVAESPVANIGTEKEETLPQSFELFENYPNPFEESTTIGFALPEHAHVVMKIFDMLGREVETVADDEFTAGNHTLAFNASRLTSGTYVLEMRSGDFTQSRLMVVVGH